MSNDPIQFLARELIAKVDLEAEVERLREALRKIAELHKPDQGNPAVCEYCADGHIWVPFPCDTRRLVDAAGVTA